MSGSLCCFVLEFFCNCQQQDTENDDGNESVGFPGKLFLQEDTGQQQGDDTDGGQNGRGNGIHTTQGIHISKLTCGFKYGSQNLVLIVLIKSSKSENTYIDTTNYAVAK